MEQWGLPPETDRTTTTAEELFEELEAIRERGYAINAGEAKIGTRAVAAPVVTDDTVHGAVAVVGPVNRVTQEKLDEHLVNDVLATVNQIEILLQQ